VFDIRILRRLFRPERGIITAGLRKCNNERLHNMYVSRTSEAINHFGDLGVDGRIILKWNFKKLYVTVGTGFKWLRIWSSGEVL
jgi:hypothetical protein